MVSVTKLRDEGNAFVFDVVVTEEKTETRHEVTLQKSDHARLAANEDATRFVERAFAFLLQREPKESILRSFDVSVISRYFPEFERVIRG